MSDVGKEVPAGRTDSTAPTLEPNAEVKPNLYPWFHGPHLRSVLVLSNWALAAFRECGNRALAAFRECGNRALAVLGVKVETESLLRW